MWGSDNYNTSLQNMRDLKVLIVVCSFFIALHALRMHRVSS